MTPVEHNRYVGLSLLGYAGFHVLTMVASIAVVGFMLSDIYGKAAEMGGDPPPPAFLGFIFVFAGVINLVLTIPSVVAGYGLLKRRPWAKVAGIVGGVVAAMSFPVGTAVAVYTFWFLFSETGKAVYGKPPETPPPPPSEWASVEQRRTSAVQGPASSPHGLG